MNFTHLVLYADFPQLDEDEGQGLVTINRHLHLIADANQEAALNVTFSLSSLIANVDVDKFYTYKGKGIPLIQFNHWSLVKLNE